MRAALKPPDLSEEIEDFITHAPPITAGLPLEAHFRELVTYQKALHRSGLAVVSWPTRYGGRGLGHRSSAEVARRLGEAGMPEVINFVGIEVLAPALMRFGQEEDLVQWLPAMAAADEIWCQLFSEPEAGSDLASLGTRAERRGSGWVVRGTKVWSTWGQFAQWGLLLARTGTAESRHRGISAFVVDMAAAGIEVNPLRTMTGQAEFAEVFLNGVELPGTALVGEPDQGWAVALEVLASERGPYAVRRASFLRGRLVRLLAVARAGGLSHRHRGLVVEAVVAMRLLDHRIEQVAAAIEDGAVPGAEAAMTKMRLTDAEQAIESAAHDLLGCGGVAWDGSTPETASGWLYSRAASIYGGSAQIQRNIIADRLLELPR